MSAENTDKKPFAYFKSLDIENIKCFKGKHHIDLTDKDGKPAKWTVIMGNNGTGKTTVLRCLADLEPEFLHVNLEDDDDKDYIIYETLLLDRNLYPEFSREKFQLELKWADLKGEYLFNTEINSSDKTSGNRYKFLDWENFDEPEINILVYGINRKIGATRINDDNVQNQYPLILNDNGLINAEEWLLKTFLAQKNGIKKASLILKRIKKLLIDVLPDVNNFEIKTNEESLESYVLFETEFGLVRVNDLGYGYQSLIAWLIDFAKKMFDRFPKSENPLAEPSVVLVDEIALHLHPDWQRDIINFLDNHFPKTQFIVTTHSPLVVQSAENVNLVLLEKDGEGVRISQPEITNLQGWSIEEIMSDIMGLNDEIFSDEYLRLMKKFEKALDTENYEMAKATYDKLDKILHPSSTQRTLMKMQMSGIMPVEA